MIPGRYTHLLRGGLVIFYLALSFWHLDQFPEIHNDEAGILEPGYNLFTRGVYGSRMYTGYDEREKIYLETMPLMPVLQGLITRLLGVGVIQMRIIPVIAGALILVLSDWIAIELTGKQPIGFLAMLLLLFWQLFPAGENAFLGSGIPLMDIARIARYDTVAAMLGLLSFWFWLKHKRTENLSFALWTGVSVGLAGLTHLYGVIWLVVFWGLHGIGHSSKGWFWAFREKSFWAMNLGVGAIMAPWSLIVLKYWPIFEKQFLQRHQARMGFLRLDFYWHNINTEIQRFHLGVHDPETYLRGGFWLFVLGVPAGLGWLFWRGIRDREPLAWRLLIPIGMFAGFLGVFDQEKRVYYLLAYFPLLAILLAWVGSQFKSRLLAIGVGILCIQGALGIGQLHLDAARRPSPEDFFSLMRESVPSSGVIIGPQTFWLAFPDRDYRSIFAPVLIALSQPDLQTDHNGNFIQILDQLNPNILIVDASWGVWQISSPDLAKEEAFQAYLVRNQAILITTLSDLLGRPVEVYVLHEN